MIRECTQKDIDMIAQYLKEEPYGRAILAAVSEYGLDAPFQTVYLDISDAENSGGELNGVYLFLHRHLLLCCRENQVDIDFLEQMMSAQAPDSVAGRKDNVNIVSWLLSDYRMETDKELPGIMDGENHQVTCTQSVECEGEWAVLIRE